MAEMKISNTLVNDTSSGEIAYARQLKDTSINWLNPDLASKIPDAFKTDANKFQSKLNDFFLKHYVEWKTFLEDEGTQEGVIDSWKELEDFLASISDSEGLTLLGMMRDIQLASGTLAVQMSTDYPGMMEAVTTVDTLQVTDSHIDEETGQIKLIYNIE